MKWAFWLFVLFVKETNEEGIGKSLLIIHINPAFPGELLIINGTLPKLNKNELVYSVLARIRTKIIAEEETTQEILNKDNFAKLLNPNRA